MKITYTPSKKDKGTVKDICKMYKALLESKIKYRKCTYKGHGRPRNDDYITLPNKLLNDYMAYERLWYGTTVSYTK